MTKAEEHSLKPGAEPVSAKMMRNLSLKGFPRPLQAHLHLNARTFDTYEKVRLRKTPISRIRNQRLSSNRTTIRMPWTWKL